MKKEELIRIFTEMDNFWQEHSPNIGFCMYLYQDQDISYEKIDNIFFPLWKKYIKGRFFTFGYHFGSPHEIQGVTERKEVIKKVLSDLKK